MGAVIGALYASGMSGRAIDSVVRTLPVSRLFHGAPARLPQAMGDLHPLLVWESGSRGIHFRSPLWEDAELNMFASRLFLTGNLLARGSFDSLPIPFRAVATDLSNRETVVLDRGDLAQGVRASYSIPVVLPPEYIDGRALVDGGLTANVPVRVARAAGATRVIVSDLAPGAPGDSINAESPLAVGGRMIDFLFEQPPDSLGPDDIRIVSHVVGVGSLDFAPDRSAMAVDSGMAAARRAFADRAASLAMRPSCIATGQRPASRPPANRPPAMRVTGFTVDGGSGAEARALARQLNLETGRALDPAALATQLDAVAASGRYVALWLTPRGSGDSVHFDAQVKRGAPIRGGVGLAYDADIGGRLWAGAGWIPTPSRAVEISGAAFVGGLRRGVVAVVSGADRPALYEFKPLSSVSFFDETVRLFTSADRVRATTETHDGVLFAGFERDLTPGWSSAVGAEGRLWQTSGAPLRGTGGGLVRAIDSDPGGEQRFSAEGAWTPVYRRMALAANGLASLGRLRVRPRLTYAAGEHLPLDVQTPLGGDDGFAGFRYGNRRGDRTLFAGAAATYPVVAPVEVILEGMSGASRLGGTAVPLKGWVTGARCGLGTDTPIGPVRLEYGINTAAQRAWLVRLGYWY
jgi:NTE family protein